MQQKSIKFFIFLSGILLLLTAVAKLFSVTGTAKILNYLDPVFLISFRQILCIAGLAELSVAAICFFSRNQKLQAGLIAILATNFALYRFGLYWQGYHSPCLCLGNLTDALRIPPQIADTAMKIILAYLLIGSYATSFCLWRQRKNTVSTTVGAASV